MHAICFLILHVLYLLMMIHMYYVTGSITGHAAGLHKCTSNCNFMAYGQSTIRGNRLFSV